jgi:hypothetical protein
MCVYEWGCGVESLKIHFYGAMLWVLNGTAQSESVTLQLTVSQSVCLGVEPRPGLMTRYLFTV